MVLLTRDKYDEAYAKLKQSSLSGGCTVLILVAADCDALCACRILTYLLRSDQICYKIKPVYSYNDVRAANDTLVRENDELRSIVMLNCGGIKDLAQELELAPHVTCFVVDAHKPWHLSNIHGSQNVVVFDDGSTVHDDLPTASDAELPSESSGDEEEEEAEELERAEWGSDEGEAEFDDASDVDAGGKDALEAEGGEEASVEGEDEAKPTDSSGDDASPQVSPARNPQGGEEDDDEEEDEEAATDGGERGAAGDGATAASGASAAGAGAAADSDAGSDASVSDSDGDDAEAEEDAMAGKRKLDAVSGVQGELTRRQRRRRVNQYYFSGSHYGSASASLMYELAKQLGKDGHDLLWLAILGVTDQFVNERCDFESYTLLVQQYQQEIMAKASEAGETIASDGQTVIPAAGDGTITSEIEYRLMMHRHWSLYESMYHSSYVASRLGTWKSTGREKLQHFLAKMGLSLRECQQKFEFMSPQLKLRLDEKLHKHGEEFGLDELFYPSFFRAFTGYKHSISAADVVYSTTALLEAGPMSQTAGEMSWEDSFNTAYDALNTKGAQSSALLQRGVELSMKLQRSVVRHGCGLMDKSGVTRLKRFRYAFLQSLPDGDQDVFSKPIALSRLALFLVDANRQSGRWAGKRALPFVILSLNEAKGSYLVAGVPCPGKFGEIEYNLFGEAFRSAAEHCNAPNLLEGFDTSIMEIPRDDCQRFIEAMHFTLGG